MSGHILFLPNRRRKDRASSMLTATPLMDLVELDDGYCLFCNVPGAEQDRVDVSVHKGILHLRAEAVFEPVPGKVHALEVCDIVYEARFQLTDAVDPARVEAGLADGVLRISLPFRGKKEPVRIPVLKG